MAAPVVRLAGITFNDGPDGDGDEFIVSDVDGWDGPGIDLTVVEKPTADGGVIALARRTSRALVVSGYVVAGAAGIGPARRKLAVALDGIVAVNGTFEVDEEDATYGLTVRLVQALRTRQVAPGVISFEAALTAPNPAKIIVP
jgi:hypothetical protein